MNLIDRALGIHPQALESRSRRMEVLARNIANADTPHYKAQDVNFRTALADAKQSAMAATQPGHHTQGEHANREGLMFRIPFNTSFDGNTVELNVEQAQYGKAAADYQATLNFLEQRISGMRKALKGE